MSNPVSYAKAERWSHYRKAELAHAIQSGETSPREASEAYGMSSEEITEILRKYAAGGPKNLLATKRPAIQVGRTA